MLRKINEFPIRIRMRVLDIRTLALFSQLHGRSMLDYRPIWLVFIFKPTYIDFRKSSVFFFLIHWLLSIGKPRMTPLVFVNTSALWLTSPVLADRKQTVRAVHSCNSWLLMQQPRPIQSITAIYCYSGVEINLHGNIHPTF